MKKLIQRSIVPLAACLVIMSFSLTANAQIPVTVTNRTNTTPNLAASYTSLANALTALNSVTAMSGPVTLTLADGSSETAPRAGLTIGSASLNAVLSSTKTVTIVRQSGTVTLNAGIGTATPSSASPDGILKLTGADWITIDGLTLTDGNISNPATMEFGIALFKLSASDGCNNNTIKNCTINMQNINNASGSGNGVEGSVGILMINSTSAAAVTGLTPTTAAGSNSNNKFYSNTINSGNYGMALIGYAASSPFTAADFNNDIGGSSSATGNQILNFGGAVSAANPSAGIRTLAQYGINASYNTINNNNGSGVNHVNVLRGIYLNTAVSANATISNNILTILSGGTTTTSTAIDNQSGSTAAGNTININNNVINACYTTATTGIYTGILNNTTASISNINGNRIIGIDNFSGTGSLTLIVCGSAAVTNSNNDTITSITRTGSSGSIVCINGGSGASWNADGCLIDGCSISNLASTGGVDGLFVSGNNITVTNCIVRNLYTPSTGLLRGISQSFGGSKTIQNNQIYNFFTTGGGTGGFTAYGISLGGGTSFADISGNDIHYLQSHGTTGGTGGTVTGIYSGNSSPAISSLNVYKNKIYGITSNSTNPTVAGIFMQGGVALTAYNNLIGNLYAYYANNALAITGINTTGIESQCNIYNNSVFLDASSSGAAFGTSALYVSPAPIFILKNNIFVNISTNAGATGFTTAFRRSNGNYSNYDTSSTKNCYYAGTPGAKNLIYYDNSNANQTLAAFKTLMNTRDRLSVTENPVFMSIDGSSDNFLKIDSTVATQLESGSSIVSAPSITVDYSGIARFPNTEYPNNGSSPANSPDIGAREFGGITSDITAPVISYTNLLNTSSTSDRTLTAIIADVSKGIPSAGTLRPRIYYKKGAGSYFSNAGTLISGSGLNGTWSFDILSADMGGVAASDIISYFVVAQDNASVINISSSPSGVVAADVNTVTSPPSSNSYTIQGSIAGTKNVGEGGDYTTLTAAVSALNSKTLTGPVVLNLTNSSYSEDETFPLTINLNGGSSPVNTVTIKPAEGNTSCAITGSSTSAPIIINGADYIIIDGSNNGSGSKDLTVTNTNAGVNSAGIWLQSAGLNGASNNIIKNCNVAGSSNLQTLIGIGIGGSSISLSSSGADANNNTITCNSITKVQCGIYTQGIPGSKNLGNVISNNLLNTTGADAIGKIAIFAGYENNIQISGNFIDGITYAGASDVIGISLGRTIIDINTNTGSEVTNATVSGNKIGMVTHTGNLSACGIYISPAISGTNTISNNSIYGVGANSTLNDLAAGIYSGGGSGSITNIYYNSISMSGTFTGGTKNMIGIAGFGANPILNILDNIISNTQVNGTGNSYAVCLGYSTLTNVTSNYNDLYTTVGATFFVGGTSSLSSPTNRVTLANWKTAIFKDSNSVSGDPGFTSANNLKIDSTNSNAWNVKGMGKPLPSVSTDISGNARSTTIAGGSTDLGAYNVTPTSTPPTAASSAAPAINTTTSYTLNGKTLASITWGSAGTPPTSMALKFYPGTTPPGANPSNAPVGSGYWIFTSSGGTGYSYDITINYDDIQIGNIGSESDIIIGKSDNGGAGYVTYPIADGGAHTAGTYLLNTTANTIKIWGLTSFSIFALTDGNAPLPVELAAFTSTVDKRNVELKWSTASEVNSSGFDIERKNVSSSSWVKAGSVEAVGNSNTVHNYNFKDRNLTTGNYNYRLKQIDNNGNFKYYELSNEVVISLPAKFDLSQNYPNPFNPTTKINYDLPFDSKVNISIYDITGRLINEVVNAQQTAGAYTVLFNGAGIASGTYFYRIEAKGNGETYVKTLKMMLVK